MLIIINLPLSVSFHTMPSKPTVVPGSHGPRQSGSVFNPTLQTSTPMLRWVFGNCSEHDWWFELDILDVGVPTTEFAEVCCWDFGDIAVSALST